MKNSVIYSVSEFNAIVKAGNEELKGIFSSPYQIINLLNKVAKGDMTKVKYCEGLSYENIKAVSLQVKKLHENRYAFDLCLFSKDSKGRFCKVASSKTCPTFGLDLVNVNEKGWYYYKPITLSVTAFYNAFAALAKVDVKAAEKARKAEEKAAEKAAKALLSEEEKAARKAKKAEEKAAEKAYKELCNKFYKGEMCAAEFAEKVATLKKAA